MERLVCRISRPGVFSSLYDTFLVYDDSSVDIDLPRPLGVIV